ncbi:unnamed protein product [Prorocentrum cordatum]|uniref:Uncharacterized protein n=1 Tax=Prorocentrum cordatum TaxID=2364126 RepID=A0ABN9VI14_9DINO|nr:unnamed protein product [Polarella glacialis]
MRGSHEPATAPGRARAFGIDKQRQRAFALLSEMAEVELGPRAVYPAMPGVTRASGKPVAAGCFDGWRTQGEQMPPPLPLVSPSPPLSIQTSSLQLATMKIFV